MPLTAIVLAKNEESSIERCLQSLTFCKEVIVMDDASSDATAQKAAQLGATVNTRSLDGNFAGQRNAAMNHAHNEWILFVDADEVVSPSLAKEIQTIVDGKQQQIAFRIPRVDWFWNQKLEHGELHMASKYGFVRLMKKGTGAWVGAVHETFQLKQGTSAFGQLKNHLEHYPHQTLTEFLLEVNSYSTMRAKELFEQNHSFSLWEAVVNPLGKFLYTYFWKAGYKDGPAGFTYSFIMSFHSFLVRAKLYQYSLSGK